MSEVAGQRIGVPLETGEIMAGRKLKLSSLPGHVLDKDDYSVCASLQAKMPCQKSYPIKAGDQVLVAWTFDGEPVVIDRILRADRSGAVTACGWDNICEDCKELKEKMETLTETTEELQEQLNALS